MSRKVGSTRGYKAKADKYFSLIVRSRGRCEACGAPATQTMHIISRRYSHTRCDLDNALAGCASCHHHFTDNPVTFGQFVIDTIGEDAYAELVRKREQAGKVDWEAEAARLKALWDVIEVSV